MSVCLCVFSIEIQTAGQIGMKFGMEVAQLKWCNFLFVKHLIGEIFGFSGHLTMKVGSMDADK